LLINIGIARFFAAGESGQIFYIVNNLSFILLLVSLSLESGAAYYIASARFESASLARFCLIWTAGASLVALGIWWLSMYFSGKGEIDQGLFLLSGFLFITGSLLITYFTALFYAKKEFVIPNRILCVLNGLLILLLVLERKNLTIKIHFLEIYFSVFFSSGHCSRNFLFSKAKETNREIFTIRNRIEKSISLFSGSSSRKRRLFSRKPC